MRLTKISAAGRPGSYAAPCRTAIIVIKSFIMKTNMGSFDRMARLVVALVLGVLYFKGTVTGALGVAALAVAAVFALTSLFGFCPLYTLFGFSSKKKG